MSRRLKVSRFRRTHGFITENRHDYGVATMRDVLDVARARFDALLREPRSK